MSTLGWFHTFTAVLALASGAVVLSMRKGTARHRQIGWVYAGSMLALNLSALMIYRLFGRFGPFHVAALISLASLASAMIPAIRRKPEKKWLERHYYGASWSYIGLLAAAASELITRVPATVFWWGVLGATLAVVAIGGTIIGVRAKHTLATARSR